MYYCSTNWKSISSIGLSNAGGENKLLRTQTEILIFLFRKKSLSHNHHMIAFQLRLVVWWLNVRRFSGRHGRPGLEHRVNLQCTYHRYCWERLLYLDRRNISWFRSTSRRRISEARMDSACHRLLYRRLKQWNNRDQSYARSSHSEPFFWCGACSRNYRRWSLSIAWRY